MKRSIRIKWGKLQVGVLIMFAIFMMMWASFTGGGTSIFESKKSFVSYFIDVNGLVKGSPIWMSGLEIGNVTSLRFEEIDGEGRVRVACRVKKSIWRYVTADATIHLGTIGFLGDKYLELMPGSTDLPSIADGGELIATEIGSAPDMFEAGEEAFSTVGSLVDNLDTLISRMNAGEGTLGQLATNDAMYLQLTDLLANLTKLSAELQKNQGRLVNSVERMSTSVADLAVKVNDNTGTIGRLVNDPALYDNMSASAARFDSILTKVDLAEGSAGLLVNDTALYVELTKLLTRANNLIADIEKDPRKYFKFSVF